MQRAGHALLTTTNNGTTDDEHDTDRSARRPTTIGDSGEDAKETVKEPRTTDERDRLQPQRTTTATELPTTGDGHQRATSSTEARDQRTTPGSRQQNVNSGHEQHADSHATGVNTGYAPTNPAMTRPQRQPRGDLDLDRHRLRTMTTTRQTTTAHPPHQNAQQPPDGLDICGARPRAPATTKSTLDHDTTRLRAAPPPRQDDRTHNHDGANATWSGHCPCPPEPPSGEAHSATRGSPAGMGIRTDSLPLPPPRRPPTNANDSHNNADHAGATTHRGPHARPQRQLWTTGRRQQRPGQAHQCDKARRRDCPHNEQRGADQCSDEHRRIASTTTWPTHSARDDRR